MVGGGVPAGAGAAVGASEAVAPPGEAVVERTVARMGTRLRVRVVAPDRAAALDASERALAAVSRTERLLSTWDEATPLSRLNRAPVGQPGALPPRLLALLGEALAWSRRTGGAVDPVVGALVDAWDLRGEGRRPSAGELAAALRATGRTCLRLDTAAARATRRCQGAWVDAGAFGKGAGLRGARRALEGSPASGALLDFGGQLLAYGGPPEGSAWRVAVAHPARRQEPARWLRLRDRSVATTSQSERFVEVDGEKRGHVLDPRTGRPVPAWGSATVVAEDPVTADLLSTALFVMGPREARRWLRGREDVGALLLETGEGGLRGWWNEPMEPFLAPAPDESRWRDGATAPRAGLGDGAHTWRP